MADNTELNPGSGGDIYAADDVSGIKFQRIKLSLGEDGEYDGDISSENPIPIRSQGLEVLRRIAALLKPLQQITGGGSNRLSLDVNNIVGGTVTTVSTVTTVTTCSTVSNVAASTLTNVANVWAFDQAKAMSRQAYNSGIRARI
jgi:hypothetical protein